jgi:Bacterial Ig-like domain (group 3)
MLRLALFVCFLFTVFSANAQTPPNLSISVGQTSSVQTATLTFTAATVSGSPFTINVLKQGSSGLDFNFASGGTCSPSATYNIGDTCTVNYTFSPLHPGFQSGVISLSVGSTALATNYISGVGEGPQINYVPPQQILLGIIGGSPDGIAVDGAGDAFVSEYFGPNSTDDGEIVEIPKGCTNGSCVLDYIDHSQLVALTNPGGDYAPGAIAMDSAGNLYVTFSYPPNSNFDTGLYEFPRGCTTAACAIPIGSGEHGVVDIAVDGSGNVYAASISGGDVSNYQVWKISPGCDLASCTAAISGIYVEINAVAADRYGNVFFTGAAKDGIPTTAYEIPAGCNDSSCIVSVETPVSTATNVTGVSTDGLGDLFYSDDYDLYEIPVGCNTSSCYLTLHTGYQFLSGPILATDGSNNVYVMDYLGVVYELDLNDPPTVTFPTTAQGNVSPQQTVTIRNGGNQPFYFSPPATYGPNPVISQYFTLDTTSAGTCGELIGSTPTPVLQPGDTCTLPINFAPVSPALDATNGTLTLADDNLNINNATQVISLTGDAALLGQTSAALSSSLNASSLGQSITFTATIASFSGTPTGSVTFTDGSATIATVALNSSGTASTTDTALTVGTHTITATYVPTGSFLSSNATLSQQVNPDVAVDVLTVKPNPVIAGTAVTLTATVTPTPVGTAPTGTVTFTSNGSNLATVSLVGGVATYSTSSLAVGTNTLGCVYSGDNNYASTNCQAVSETVGSGTTPASIALVSSANPADPYTTIDFTATLTSNGKPIDNNLISLTIDGVLVSSRSTSRTGQAGLPSQDGLAPGQHTVIATSSVESTYAIATASLTETVNLAPTTSTLTANPATATAGSPVTLTATLGGSLDDQADGITLIPTRTVTFYSNGTALSTVAVTNSTATYTTSTLPPGTDNITCTYSGDANFASSNCTSASVTVSPIVSTLSVTPSANPSPALSAVTFSATLLGGSAPLGSVPVVFGIDGANVATATTNAQGVATYTSPSLSVGQHTVTATFAGSGSYAGAQSAALSEQIQANPTSTTLSASPNPVQQGQPLTVSVSVSAAQGTAAPTGSVALVQSSTTLATTTLTTPSSGVISTANLTISALPAGSDSIQVNYTPADGNFVASSSSLSSVTVDVPDFAVAANPTSMNVESGQTGSATITIASLGLFAGSVQLSCGSGLPQYMSCSFTQSTATLSANGTTSSTLTINTKQAPQTAFLRSGSRLNEGVLFAMLIPFAFLRLKKNKDSAGRIRHFASITMAFLCVGSILVSLAGCGSTPDSTPGGTYTIPIVVSGTNDGGSTPISHTLNYSVVVGK